MNRDVQMIELIDKLVKLPKENEYVEFKKDFHSCDEIGKDISALSNSANLHNHEVGYLVFGIEDGSHNICGTGFDAKKKKKGNEELENWLITRLNPRIDFRIHVFQYDSNKKISLFVIPATINQPVTFSHIPYIRIGSITRKLEDFPDKQSKIWKKKSIPFEKCIALDNIDFSDISKYLSIETYFDLMKIPIPSNYDNVVQRFLEEKFIVKNNGYSITNLGAMLFAKDLSLFETINRKAVRVIVYRGQNKVETVREQIGTRGYALGFTGMVDWINSQLPANEEIGKALRTETRMYPEISIRELVANALIHQDFNEKGFPMVEIFSDRIEISNPGIPLVTPDRFIDGYQSRNEFFADIMRRLGYCEEKGSGLDKVIHFNEFYQLPPINVIVAENRTRITIYSYKELKKLDKKEKIRACYQHACLKYVSNEKMTNQSLRERFSIASHNYSIASRIIKDALDSGKVKEDDPESKSRKYASYIPFWA